MVRKIKRGILVRLNNFLFSIKFVRYIARKIFNMKEVRIRQEVPADYAKIKLLFENFHEANYKTSANQDVGTIRPGERKIEKYSYVAEYKDKIIGRTIMSQSWKEGYKIDGYVISGTFVSEGFRGLGVGETLYRALVKQAREDNIDRIYQGVFNTNKRNIKLARKLGFKKVNGLLPEINIDRDQPDKKLLAFCLDLPR